MAAIFSDAKDTDVFDLNDALDAMVAAETPQRIRLELRDTGGATPPEVRLRHALKLLRKHGFCCTVASQLKPGQHD